jgi:hypothetical protein
VRANVADYDWAKEGQAEYLRKAEAWEVPEIARRTGQHSSRIPQRARHLSRAFFSSTDAVK